MMNEKSKSEAVRAAMRRTFLYVGLAIAGTGLGLAACVPAEPEPLPPPPPAPAPTPAPAPPPPPPVVAQPPADWRDLPITPGDWTYRADTDATRAIFASPDGAARFIMACEVPTRTIKLWRAGVAPAGATMTITTTSAAQTLPLSVETNAAPMLSTTLAPRDPLIDAIVFSRGRFSVAVPTLEVLYLPSWAEVARVTEDCR